MKAEHTVASYNGRDFTSKIATVYIIQNMCYLILVLLDCTLVTVFTEAPLCRLLLLPSTNESMTLPTRYYNIVKSYNSHLNFHEKKKITVTMNAHFSCNIESTRNKKKKIKKKNAMSMKKNPNFLLWMKSIWRKHEIFFKLYFNGRIHLCLLLLHLYYKKMSSVT
jgi:hypothetical protein